MDIRKRMRGNEEIYNHYQVFRVFSGPIESFYSIFGTLDNQNPRRQKKPHHGHIVRAQTNNTRSPKRDD